MKKVFSLFAFVLMNSWGVATAQEVVEEEKTEVPVATEAVAEEEEGDPFAKPKIDWGVDIANHWEYRLDFIFNTTTGTSTYTSDESGGLEFSMDYNLNSIFSVGVSTGYIHDFGGTSGMNGSDVVPLLGDFQMRFNIAKKCSFYALGRAGLLCAIKDSPQGKDGFRYPNYLYYEVQPGIMYRPTTKFEFRLSAGYGYAVPYHESAGYEDRTYDETIISFKLGLAYRFH